MKKLTLTDRESIEIGIVKQQPLSKIGTYINKHPSSISREIKTYRLFLAGSYYAGNDCKYAKGCTKRHLCGSDNCPMYCYTCNNDCHKYCNDYVTTKCEKYNKPPYVCNGCSERRYCNEDRYFYDAKVADRKANIKRSESREGIHVNAEELDTINTLITNGLNKGQPLTHILSSHENEIIISERTAYRYINDHHLDVINADLRRKVRYKKRRKKKESGILNHAFRQGRSYQDFLQYMESHSECDVCEMDTVKGCRGYGKVLLTMLLRRNSVMLMFIMPDCKAESVIDRLDFLEKGLGTECFRSLFGTILTDNGSEFKRVNEIEHSCITPELTRTSVYFCDPMASGQKGRLEKNHEYIRYVIPKGTSLNPFSQEDFTILMNHINSTKRPGLQNQSPYEIITYDDEDMRKLMKLLSLKEIPADDVNLTKSLLIKRNPKNNSISNDKHAVVSNKSRKGGLKNV